MGEAPLAAQKGYAAEGPHATSIWPRAQWLPANILRFYVRFSEPAEAFFDRAQLRLVAVDGAAIPEPFLRLNEELWSPDGRRLTVLMEPGRIKRGMGWGSAHEPALAPGEFYRLEVAMGGRVATKLFGVLPSLMEPLQESRWRLTRPHVGTRQPVKVRFDRVMDDAIVADEVDVQGPKGLLTGVQVLCEDGRQLAFRPFTRWEDSDYRLVFSRRFEDACGNRLGEALDHLFVTRQRARSGAMVFRPRA
jgi:hypothetical protein